MNWTCEQIETRLSEYVDGSLDASALSAFEGHANGCQRCAPLVARVAGIVAQMHALEMLAEPPQLAEQILARTLGPRANKAKRSGVLDWFRPMIQPRFAYGAVSVLVTFGVMIPALGIDWHKPKLADLRPINIYRAADREAHLVYARGAKFVSDLRVVYEIQSRLRPETEPQSAPDNEPQPTKSSPSGTTNGPQKNPRGLNRARQFSSAGVVLASAVPGACERISP
ncbi:MAG TPA: zf-HC2 domain-containing protein [Candidatus Dormibacteraeota bacterium]|nr:zf-HC2 domain-containing protein [Candidatus Dormibacteraeota bacterium]